MSLKEGVLGGIELSSQTAFPATLAALAAGAAAVAVDANASPGTCNAGAQIRNVTPIQRLGVLLGMAIGLLMERHRLDRETAFELLRESARSRRQRIHEVSAHQLESIECVNELNSVAAQRVRSKG